MSFDFPNTPSDGTTYSPAGGPQYVYTGGVWRQVSAGQIKLPAQRQNIVVNGSFAIGQENGTTQGVAHGFYAADQWQLNASGLAPSGQLGFISAYGRNSVVINNTAAAPAPTAGQYIALVQYLEASRMANLHWDKPALAVPAVLNFKMQADVSGTYGCALRDSAGGSISIGFDLPYLTSEGLKEFTFAIPPPGIGTWQAGTTVGQGGSLAFTHTTGSTWKSTAQGVWETKTSLGGPGMTVNSTAANSYLRLFDVQLVADPQNTGVAPPYVQNPYAFDLNECLRYWRRLDRPMLYLGSVASITLMYVGQPYSPSMRITPTVGAMALTNAAYTPGGGSTNATSGSFVAISADGGYFIVGVTAGMSGIAAGANAVTLNAR